MFSRGNAVVSVLSCTTCTKSGIIDAGDVISLRCCRLSASDIDLHALRITHADSDDITDVDVTPFSKDCVVASFAADDPQKDGTYVCLYQKCTSVTLNSFIKLSIDFDQSSRPTFSCQVRNDYMELACHWSVKDEGHVTNRWSLAYKERLV